MEGRGVQPCDVANACREPSGEAESSEAAMRLSTPETMVAQTAWWPWSRQETGTALIEAWQTPHMQGSVPLQCDL